MSNKYTFTQEKLKARLIFNPGLVLIGFQTTQLRSINKRFLKILNATWPVRTCHPLLRERSNTP